MKFQLLSGFHEDENGERYEAGDLVVSDIDLVKCFGSNKFRRLTDEEFAAMKPQDEKNKAGREKGAFGIRIKPVDYK